MDSTGGGGLSVWGGNSTFRAQIERAIVVDLGILRSSISELTGALVPSHIVTVSHYPPFFLVWRSHVVSLDGDVGA